MNTPSRELGAKGMAAAGDAAICACLSSSTGKARTNSAAIRSPSPSVDLPRTAIGSPSLPMSLSSTFHRVASPPVQGTSTLYNDYGAPDAHSPWRPDRV